MTRTTEGKPLTKHQRFKVAARAQRAAKQVELLKTTLLGPQQDKTA
jgi:hypothetical protein